jgi:hypothetical protein
MMRSLRRDLIERKLWLVLVVLVAAIVAVPLLLLKSAAATGTAAATPAPPALATTSTQPSAQAGGTSATAKAVSVKTLEASLPRNPFASGQPKLASKPAAETPSAASSSATTTTSASATAAPASMVSPTPAASSAPATPTTSTTSTTPASTTTTATTASTPTSTVAAAPSSTPAVTQSWTIYSVAVRYGKDTSVPVRTDLPRLAPLPSVTSPQVMFMGVMAGGQDAVFALGSGLGHSGPGVCRPDHVQCAAIVLRAGQTEVITVPTASGGHRKMLLKLVRVSSSVTHSHSVALAAYQRHSAAGQCELDLSDPVSYSAAAGTLSSVAKATCADAPGAVPFPTPGR